MSSSLRSYARAFSENPYKKQLMNTLMALVFGAVTITAGAFLVDDQNLLKTADNSKTSEFRYYSGITCIVLGSLIVLYIMYSFFNA